MKTTTSPTWTKTPPTAPGWYWWRATSTEREPKPVQLRMLNGAVCLNNLPVTMYVDCEWWPIPLEVPA